MSKFFISLLIESDRLHDFMSSLDQYEVEDLAVRAALPGPGPRIKVRVPKKKTAIRSKPNGYGRGRRYETSNDAVILEALKGGPMRHTQLVKVLEAAGRKGKSTSSLLSKLLKAKLVQRTKEGYSLMEVTQ